MSLRPDEYDGYDAVGLAGLVARGEVSPDELLDVALDAAATEQPRLNALVHLVPETARRLIRDGLPDGPLRGVPFLLKDLGAEAIDFPSSSGSRLFADTRYRYDSEIYLRLRRAGLVTFGRATSPEGGVGPVTEAVVYGGPTRNPWNPDHTPGGSSGGSAAAVAAGVVPAAHGSDGGGSVRIPASCCGLVGFKATRARLPDGPAAGEGWAGMAIDGFLTRSVRDTATLLDATAGADLGAPYWAPPLAGTFADAIARPPRRLRVAVLRGSPLGEAIHPQCRSAVDDAARLLDALGHHVEEASPIEGVLPLMRAWTTVVACGTALTIESKVRARGRPLEPDEIEPVARGAIALAHTLGGADYLAAVNTVHAFGRTMARYLAQHDVLLSATLAEPPARVGRFAHRSEDFVDYRLGPQGIFAYSPFTALFNASGQPAASLPLHWSADGLPVGVHLAARFGDDELLLALCAELETARPWFGRRPPGR
ncbi:MAG: amidase [Ectothiorhodospiraceae bacterium]|nr:amidase [Ectothiorhodospiraceae bacterium]